MMYVVSQDAEDECSVSFQRPDPCLLIPCLFMNLQHQKVVLMKSLIFKYWYINFFRHEKLVYFFVIFMHFSLFLAITIFASCDRK
jgi:hypothetical protein